MKTKQDRRTFIKTLAGGAAALGSSLAGWPDPREASPGRLPQDALARRPLGRTGLSVSEISLGSSPLPDPDLLRAIIDRGVNYIDSSHNYENGNAERRNVLVGPSGLPGRSLRRPSAVRRIHACSPRRSTPSTPR